MTADHDARDAETLAAWDAPLRSVGEMEAVVGTAALGVKMKVIDTLDAHARDWIAASRLGFVAAGTPDGPTIAAAGGAPGFAATPDAQTLRLPRAALDRSDAFEPGRGVGCLFLATGVGETLRVKGRVRTADADAVEVAIDECFIHCAKALIRSAFWTAPRTDAPQDALAFLAATRFAAVATMNAQGAVDVSPKGDAAGMLFHVGGGFAAMAERPGNRLAFGYRNLLEQPRVAALCVIPGANAAVELRGEARLSAHEPLRRRFAVEGKTPILTTLIRIAAAERRDSPALRAGQPAFTPQQPVAIDPAEAFVAHVKLNKASGVQATMMRLAVNRGLVAQGLKTDYAANLY